MIKLNLLSPAEKKDLRIIEFNRLIFSLTGWLLIILVIFSIFLASAFLSLSILLKEQTNLITIRENEPQMQNLLEIEEKIKRTNQVIKQIDSKQQQMVLWTPLLEGLTKIVPTGVCLTTLSYQSNSDQIILNGWADRRESLLHFQKSLEESSFFTEVETPLANLVKEKDIDFSFTLHLNSD